MNSLYLRLAAPLQSWAGSKTTGNFVFTERIPTRSGLTGLLAAALGAPRGHWPDWLQSVKFSVRTDRSGSIIDEYQTINPREEDLKYQQRMYRILSGKRWTKTAVFTPDARNLTSIVRRTYLADAEFIVQISSHDHSDEIANALISPIFSPYLGRRAFAPTMPFVLGWGARDQLLRIPHILPKYKSLNSLASDDVHLRIDHLSEVTSEQRSRETAIVPALKFSEWLPDVRARLTWKPPV